MLDPRRSCGPVVEWRRIRNPSPGVTPGELSQDGATCIFGVIRVFSDNRLLAMVFATFKKLLLSLFEDENHLKVTNPNNNEIYGLEQRAHLKKEKKK